MSFFFHRGDLGTHVVVEEEEEWEGGMVVEGREAGNTRVEAEGTGWKQL